LGTINLSDILLTPLSKIETTGGDKVQHAMKQFDPGYQGFGEAYFSSVSYGAIRAWKRHTKMVMNLIVPIGSVRFVFCLDAKVKSNKFRIEDIGHDSYARITVPPGIWFGFKGLSESKSLVLNIANIPHDPIEVERIEPHEINYIWSE